MGGQDSGAPSRPSPCDGAPEGRADPRRFSRLTLVAGALAGAAACAMLALPFSYWAYRTGRERGRDAERRRMFSGEVVVRSAPFEAAPEACFGSRNAAARAVSAGIAASPEADGPKGPRCFGPLDCVRVVWPMEIAPADADVDHPHFRVRQGANRFARPGQGVCEFAFRVYRPVGVAVYARCRYTDDCGNSLACRIDGGPTVPLGNTAIYDTWLWERAYLWFDLAPGLHRLTLETREDGLVFDKVVVTSRAPGEGADMDAYLDRIAPTRPPAFASLPVASWTLPEIGPVAAQAFATGSLVIGSGHRNALTVFVRDNRGVGVKGRVLVRSGLGDPRTSAEFELTPAEPARLMSWDLDLSPGDGYVVPVDAEVWAGETRIHSQQINFVSPLSWAFLGPFPDPGRRGLDLALAPDAAPGELALLPAFEGREWKIVEDGSCYDEMGVVDLNKVFGLTTERWHEHDVAAAAPAVAYAVTQIAPGGKHDTVAIAGDDAVLVWQNGRQILRVDTSVPMETSRQVLGLKLDDGLNAFAFKVSQAGHYWQILFEPDGSFPYSHVELFRRVPVAGWR